MGGVDVGGGGGGKRAVNADINMIPFIDLLMVTIAFLLITAVWVTNSRMNANAQVPGPPNTEPTEVTTPEKILHLHVEEFEFKLVWQQGSTVVAEDKVPKQEQTDKEFVKYGDLAVKIAEQWQQHGGHQDPSDQKTDQCVVHADNKLPFRELVGVLDAIYDKKREQNQADGTIKNVPVFNMSFSIR
ncbi:MAG: biopolymer transporter ExbD [Polyangiaceae bacterium]|nr:biopolymer transporter ExbD [Polyangiaceae bacterium]